MGARARIIANGCVSVMVAETIANGFLSALVAETIANRFVTALVAGTVTNGLVLWLSIVTTLKPSQMGSYRCWSSESSRMGMWLSATVGFLQIGDSWLSSKWQWLALIGIELGIFGLGKL
nr:hypothetical protein CFP56_35073 [Quercus suber]